MINIAIFASGNGTNAENIARYYADSTSARVVLVLTNRRNAGVIDRMKPLGITTEYIPNSVWDNEPHVIIDILKAHKVDLVVLAGYMRLIAPAIITAFPRRIVNIHPSLLPAHGGKGMYGHHVHEAVIADCDAESGVTVHYVDEQFDNGEIIMQERLLLAPGETAESLEEKIHPIEYSLYPRALDVVVGRLTTPPPIIGSPTQQADSQWAKALHIDYDPATAPHPVPSAPPSIHPEEPADADKPEAPKTPTEPMPANYLVLAVLALVLCCLPTGIIAVIYSSQVSTKYYAGDIEGAKRCSERVQQWIIASFCIGLIWSAAYIPLTMIMGSVGG